MTHNIKKEIIMAKQNTYSKNHSSNKAPKTHIKEINLIYLVPIMFTIAVIPLIVKIHEYRTGLSNFLWFTENDNYFDFFLFYKQAFLVATAVSMLILILLAKFIKKEPLPFSITLIPLGIYAVLALLSSLFSDYRAISIRGVFEQFESIFVILSYCLLAYYTFIYVKSERDIKYVINSLLASVFMLSLLGLSQFIGHDFYKTQLGWNLISNAKYASYMNEFSFEVLLGRVYLSFYNPNYVGMYVSLILPIILFLTLFTKNSRLRLLYLLADIGLAICLIGSGSTAGLVSVFAALFLLLILSYRYLLKYLKFVIPIIVIMIIVFITFNIKTNFFSNQINKITNLQKTPTPMLTEIQTNDDNITIVYNNSHLIVSYTLDPQSGICLFQLTDENNFPVVSNYNLDGTTTVIDERFSGFTFTPMYYDDNTLGFTVLINNKTWFFTNQVNDNTYYYLNDFGRFTKMITAPSALFTGYEAYASGRGYIWSRSIPLIRDNIILGSGADTYIFEFPHFDYVNLYNYGFSSQLLSKPHSLYLQIAIQTGLLSLIAFIAFYLMYFVSSIRLYMKGNFNNLQSVIGAAVLAGTFGYMVCALTNDSSITVAPVFWLLTGLGLAMNHMVKQDQIKSAQTSN
jgi:hypothetical protein